MTALGGLPPTMLHGDLKLSNVASLVDGIALIDWQMASRAPVAVELGWFLVSNVAQLPEEPEMVLDRYRTSVDAVAADAGPGCRDRRLGGAGRPGIRHRPAPARLAEGPRRRGRPRPPDRRHGGRRSRLVVRPRPRGRRPAALTPPGGSDTGARRHTSDVRASTPQRIDHDRRAARSRREPMDPRQRGPIGLVIVAILVGACGGAGSPTPSPVGVAGAPAASEPAASSPGPSGSLATGAGAAVAVDPAQVVTPAPASKPLPVATPAPTPTPVSVRNQLDQAASGRDA